MNYLKFLGFLYILFSIFGSLLGFSFSLLIRLELNSPFTVLGEYFYYVSLTSHGVIMVFYFLTLLSTGFYFYLISEMVVLNVNFLGFSFLSLLFVFISMIFLVISLFLGEFVNTGWTIYHPLSSFSYNDSFCLDLAIFSLIIFTISSIISSINIFILFFLSINFFESFLDISVFVWSGVLTSFLILFSTPSLICALVLLVSDRILNTYYFDFEFGGSSILFQSVFWFWGHPEVYILILPVFGVVSHCIFVSCFGFVYNKNGIVFSMLSLTVLSFLVWGHHMVTAGLDLDVKGFFMVSTIVISIPTGVKVFSWLYSVFIFGGCFNSTFFLILSFIVSFSFGGVTGVFLSNYSLDIVFHDSYFVIGHFHTILAVSSFFGYISCFSFLFENILFKFSNIFVYFLLSIVFVSMTQLMVSFHIKGLISVARRVSNYFLDYYFLFYLGGIGVLGVWFSLFIFFIFIFVFINNKCGDEK